MPKPRPDFRNSEIRERPMIWAFYVTEDGDVGILEVSRDLPPTSGMTMDNGVIIVAPVMDRGAAEFLDHIYRTPSPQPDTGTRIGTPSPADKFDRFLAEFQRAVELAPEIIHDAGLDKDRG